MSELQRMARSLLERPLVDPPPIDDLRRRNQKRHRRHLASLGATALVIALVIVVVVAILPGSQKPARRPVEGSRLAAFIQTGVAVPDSVLEAVGVPSQLSPPTSLKGQPPLTDQGKPAVVYVGAEFCPYCALQRWALVVALSRFGTFSNLGQIISSSSTDVFPGLQSWSFSGSTYSSRYLTFDPAEVESSTPTPTGRGFEPLDSLSPLESRAFDTYDVTSTGSKGGMPFVDVANRFASIGWSSSGIPNLGPAVLEGLSLDQIAADLSSPTSTVAQAIDGEANYLVAALCEVIGMNAAPMCSSSVVAQAQTRMSS